MISDSRSVRMDCGRRTMTKRENTVLTTAQYKGRLLIWNAVLVILLKCPLGLVVLF